MKLVKYIAITAISLIGLSGCMDIQDSYDYEPANIDNNVYMNTLEFIDSRQDVFSQMKKAIEHSEIDQSIYTQTDKKYTYLLLNNDAFGGVNGILANNGVSKVEDMDKEKMKNILLYHIVNGYYHGLGTLSFDAINVITLWKDPNAIMTMKLNNSTSIESYSRLVINDMAGSSTPVTAVTSNILTTNGAVHVVNKQIIYLP